MTKTQAKDQGRADGIAFVDMFDRDQLLQEIDDHRDGIRQSAASIAVGKYFRTVDSPNAQQYISAFIEAAGLRFLGRARELPEVRNRERREGFDWRLRSMLKGAEEKLQEFRGRIDDDPVYAFEWADGAMEAAARRWAAKCAQAWLDQGLSLDEVIEKLRGEALRGARYPSHSSSGCTNMMAAFKASAFAELAEGGW